MTDAERIREARNAYYRQYRAQNRDRIKAINQRYWEKKAKLNKPYISNFDYIKRMSVEELAQFLAEVESAPLDSEWIRRASAEVCALRCGKEKDCEGNCDICNPKKLFFWWLNQPHKEENF